MKVEIDARVSSRRERGDGERRPDLVCFSHLRWSFVFQRPQHLLTRGALTRRVFFFEEPESGSGPPRLETSLLKGRVHVAVPRLPRGLSEAERVAAQRELVGQMLERHAICDYALWYYTPMALPFTRHLAPAAILYDCMDELSAFKGAPPALRALEAELFRRADVVLTGGQSLYEAKRYLHDNIHLLPSSVDVAHFERARRPAAEPADQAVIRGPRLGFAGVIDERMDLDLLRCVAAERPDWHLVLIGPVVKIDPDTLPRLPNIHYLGAKEYDDLPRYLAGWDVALLPFARNHATRFISPTKTPEYLAAGKPVVSTSIKDVVRPYGSLGFVRIADTTADFIAAVSACLAEERGDKLTEIDRFLSQTSWDRTWARAEELLDAAVSARKSTWSEEEEKEDQCSII